MRDGRGRGWQVKVVEDLDHAQRLVPRRVLRLFERNGLLSLEVAESLHQWRHGGGSSFDASVWSPNPTPKPASSDCCATAPAQLFGQALGLVHRRGTGGQSTGESPALLLMVVVPLTFPDALQDRVGFALYQAHAGLEHCSVKPLKGVGSSVLEVVSRHDGNAYRAVYAVRFKAAVYVLHAFQKKAKKRIAPPKQEIDLIKGWLKSAQQRYKATYSKT